MLGGGILNKPHKWAKEIKAWADGAEIEYKTNNVGGWHSWTEEMGWYNFRQYRIKPQPKEPDFDATKYQKALKESGKKFKEKIEQAFAEILDKEVSKLAQPKEPQYLYVYRCTGDGELRLHEDKDLEGSRWKLKGKIKLEVDDE